MGRGGRHRVNKVNGNSTININGEHESGTSQLWSVSKHSYADLTHVSPLVFLYLLKEFYVRGKSNITAKFRYLQKALRQPLDNAPQPGPATFVAHCLFLLTMFGTYCEELSHLIINVLDRVLETRTISQDLLGAKSLAAHLFLYSVHGQGQVQNILMKMVKAFHVQLEDIHNAANHGTDLDATKAVIEQYIFYLVESELYKTAGKLLIHFSLGHSGESYILKMIQGKRYEAARKLAASMGTPTLCVLAQHYLDQSMSALAYEIIKKHPLRDLFPDAYQKGKKSSLKRLAEKGLWDLAEERTKKDKQLLEYLANLAMEARYFEKAEELRDRYSLEGFDNVKELEASPGNTRFLQFDEQELEGIKWVDDACGLCDALFHIEKCDVVGLDCEYTITCKKGQKPKVCIMQIAAENMVYILDLIKLFEDVQDVLDDCLSRIFHSPEIIKLGYGFEHDMKHLAFSYEALNVFNYYDMLLDFDKLFNERGGLSGLTKTILGAELDKTRRVSNWEQRPLTQKQLEYAALDAAVLLKIFARIRDDPEFKDLDWTSHIVHRMGMPVMQMNITPSGWD